MAGPLPVKVLCNPPTRAPPIRLPARSLAHRLGGSHPARLRRSSGGLVRQLYGRNSCNGSTPASIPDGVTTSSTLIMTPPRPSALPSAQSNWGQGDRACISAVQGRRL